MPFLTDLELPRRVVGFPVDVLLSAQSEGYEPEISLDEDGHPIITGFGTRDDCEGGGQDALVDSEA